MYYTIIDALNENTIEQDIWFYVEYETGSNIFIGKNLLSIWKTNNKGQAYQVRVMDVESAKLNLVGEMFQSFDVRIDFGKISLECVSSSVIPSYVIKNQKALPSDSGKIEPGQKSTIYFSKRTGVELKKTNVYLETTVLEKLDEIKNMEDMSRSQLFRKMADAFISKYA